MFFFFIILIIGLLTTFTDLKNKKIYNQHLGLGAVLCLIAITYAAIRHEEVLSHIVNGLAAFLIGWLLHRFALWRGGDAKLFTLYAFLMPTPAGQHLFLSSVVCLFACSFIIGTVILIPVLIKDIIINHKIIANDLFSPEKRQALFKAIVRIIYSTWILLPFLYLARATNPVIILTVSYLFFNWGYKIQDQVKEHFIIKFLKKESRDLAIGILFGFFMRLWLSPNSLSFPALTRYILMVSLSTVLSTCIHTTFYHFKNYHERVPFAPLLFIGCILSYTPFLTSLMQVMRQWNVLFYR